MNKYKNGYISIEYMIAVAILFGVTVMFLYSQFPESAKNVLNKSSEKVVSVLNPKIDNGEAGTDIDFSEGGGTTVYPDEEKWDAKEDFVFTGDASGITIVEYKGTKTDVVIPAVINDNEVIKISNNAFANKNIKTVRIPNSIRSIGVAAFKGNKLQLFIAPVSLESIGNEAFMNNELAAVAFNNKLNKIGIASFKNNQLNELDTKNVSVLGKNSFHNNQINTLKLGQALTTIGEGSFYEQGGLSGKLGNLEIFGEEARFNSIWESIFDIKFTSLKPKA